MPEPTHTIPRATMEGSRGEPSSPTQLPVIEGAIPASLAGTWFIMAAVGDLDHPTLTVPRDTSVLNGDGFIYKVRFQSSAAELSQVLVRNASYVADEVAHQGQAGSPKLQFSDAGIARVQFPQLGTRDQSNTSVIPIRTHPAAFPQLLVSYDAGRPHVVDPGSGKVLGAIGARADWAHQLGGLFPMFVSGAHPAFDPKQHELFVVSAARSLSQMTERLWRIVKPAVRRLAAPASPFEKDELGEEEQRGFLRTFLTPGESGYLKWLDDEAHAGDGIGAAEDGPLSGELPEDIDPRTGAIPSPEPLDGRKRKRWREVLRAAMRMLKTLRDWVPRSEPSLRLLVQRAGGSAWFDIEVDRKTLEVRDSLHQINITDHYVVLADTCFKFEVDQILPDTLKFKLAPSVRRDLRARLSRRQNTTLPLYFIKREDLGGTGGTVNATRVELPRGGVHWMTQAADNGGNAVRVLVAHGNATDVAEFIDSSDLNYDGTADVDPELRGFFGAPLDAGQMGLYTINPSTGTVSEALATPSDGKKLWGVGLGTGLTQPGLSEGTLDQTYWYTLGLAPETVTQLNYNLYAMDDDTKDAAERVVSKADFRALLKAGGEPGFLFRTECKADTVSVVDVWEAPWGVAICSPQAVLGSDESQWLLCVLFAPKPEVERRIAIFDAKALAKGPVALLDAGAAQWPYTLHSCWLDEGLGTEDPLAWAQPLLTDLDVVTAKGTALEALVEEVRKRLGGQP